MERQDELEIDIVELLYYLRRRAAVIIALTVICGLLSFVHSAFVSTPMYTASTRVYVLNRASDAAVVYSDFQISNYMLRDYQVLISGPNVTGEVISRLELDLSEDQLAGAISVNSQENTRILDIGVTSEDPRLAADLANCVREVAAAQIKEFMDVDAVKTVYEAGVPMAPSTPDIRGNTLLGTAVGFMAAVVLLMVLFLLDDSIRTEEDVERYLGLSTLGVIPESGDLRIAGSASPVRKRKMRKHIRR